MKFFKKNTDFAFGQVQRNENERVFSKAYARVGHLRRKLSRGAANIFRIIKTRNKWGNKQLWGFREKGRNK
jgi:hypothetical protein